MSNRINLTALVEARAKMTPGTMTWEPTGLLAVETDDPLDPIILGELDVTEDNGAGIVATHNAADVLIEVARAAKRFVEEHGSWCTEAHVLISALAKVSL